MRNAAVYVRISEDREGSGLEVKRQEADCRDLASQIGWGVADVYVDNGLSAYNGKPRPAYRRLLVDLSSGRVDSVLAWHADRLHRSPAELERRIESARRRLAESSGDRVLESVRGVARTRWPEVGLDQRRAILAALIERITIGAGRRGLNRFDPDRLAIAWRA